MKNNVIDFPKQVSRDVILENELDLITEIRALLSEFQNDYPLLIKRAILTRVDLLTKQLVTMN
ncbi:hypothetical protein M1K46_14510 [Fictibacillus sp. WQ 8-8]|uniref:Uncharacterized protein n=1 Tax=Fictibacillus marinisediminis TaxID=2878389 RepID=A0A9X1XAX7_9BACL|nr:MULTISPECIES: hypothetical protein [Fictibacillus]SFF16886.1 hypothetical protein SAMN05428981_1206 [Bacillus sp. OV194]MCK6256043.1 hypothetical protein [Fictibacillus marinisediminis]MCQ6266864.1 hypothetical protein [Fictibacillus sp. WQ 8-8]MED2973897.1 hypothetical protein [Fictibacillus sp. B-59209]UZJ78030.1 hypothetical protein OKX00_18030 [Fictibacillus sp. KU28468]